MDAPHWCQENTEKVARQELHKNAACCLEQILEATPHKTAAIRPSTSHLTNHPSKTNKTWRALLEKWRQLLSNVLLWAPTHGHTNIVRPTRIYIHHFCVGTRCSWEDLPGLMGDWMDNKRVRELCAVRVTWWWWRPE